MQTPAPTDYVRATSVANAIALLEEHGEEARILAGGHSLLPMMKLRIARPEMLIDINDLDELRGIRVEGDELVLGAMVTHREVLESPILSEHYAVFREAEKVIADPLVRNRGTVGGSMCQADPSEDLSALGAALRGTVVIQNSSGSRTVPLREFHEGPYETKVGPAEMLTEVRFPIRPGAGSAYEKVERRVGDWAVCSAGVFVTVKDGVVADCGIGLTAVGAEHFCAPDAEAFLIGKAPTEENLRAAAKLAGDASDPSSDQRGPADYKKHLAEELTFRALTRAAAASQGA
ncbi:MAG: xanthine dehydrogenase family protein subunit M [Candidatus Nanopelagicales bacterium]|nr:xanthine dehydrogenase family protein subunit M [Candidatus Nanopelagicales bacterium]MCF8536902.1 xanthine dehydrogenase family protein subunit M [Candidatus Nanopelagicales bacterium]MCF8542032.1 xanthine dehydrogenase family protein subunit M [Candidatus Nanopelagicales bacterium]MCF8556720.1 xanthine dehydrogenase family protein subunit M [Candidatus Nanopelagicales bacterium]